jgi:hypothetical protein
MRWSTARDNHNISRHFDEAMKATVQFFHRWLRAPVNLFKERAARVRRGSEVNLRAGPVRIRRSVGKMKPGDSLEIVRTS